MPHPTFRPCSFVVSRHRHLSASQCVAAACAVILAVLSGGISGCWRSPSPESGEWAHAATTAEKSQHTARHDKSSIHSASPVAQVAFAAECAQDQQAPEAIAQLNARRARVAALRNAKPHPKRFDEPAEAMDFYIKQRLAPGQLSLPIDQLKSELETLLQREALGANAATVAGASVPPGGVLSWSELGPRNIGGRTRALVIHPTSPSIMYAGGVAGGVWKSTDGGANWNNLDDFMLNLSVCSLAMDPVDPNTLYAGTGEGFFNIDAVRGLGIFKTTNGGNTWSQLAGTVDQSVPEGAFYRVSDIVISPNDHNRIYAATRYGVYRSLDAGANWSIVLANPSFTNGPQSSNGSSQGCLDLAIRADRNPDVVLAAFGSFDDDGLFRSTNGGDTWSQLGTVADLRTSRQGRMSLAIAPSNNDVMYVCMAADGDAENVGSLVNVFRSSDGGTTWSPRVDLLTEIGPWLLSNLIFANFCLGVSFNFAQGWYDNVIAVDPLNPDRVWVGGIDLFRSNDGGVNWGIASYWYYTPGDAIYVHADQHAIVFHPQYNGTTNQVMYVANDGGVHRTANALAATTLDGCPLDPIDSFPDIVWAPRNNGYGVTQFYHGDSAVDRTRFAGGTQDNGTLMVNSIATPAAWSEILGGDGGYVAIDSTNGQIIYAETTDFPSIMKSTDGGVSFEDATAGITDFGGQFINPFAMDPSNPRTLWSGGNRPWRTTNGAQSWTLAAPQGFPFVGYQSAIAIAPSNRNVVYYGFDEGVVIRTDNALSNPPAWSIFDSGNGLPFGYISSIAVDPLDPMTAYCTYSNFGIPHIFRTSDGGENWTSIDGSESASVPDVPVHWIAVRPCRHDQLYVGTDLGLFASDDTGLHWWPANRPMPGATGLPHTVVESIDFPQRDTLIAFTHGRGAFQARLAPCFDCNTNQTDDEAEILVGSAADCDSNRTPDACDLAGGAGDCNTNGILDTCPSELGNRDCNSNRVPDACDLATATNDCNTNGTVDACPSELTGRDCNNNLTPDACELAGGGADCDTNDTLDSCPSELGLKDCNTNLVPDRCELDGGLVRDCNTNQTPDLCSADLAGRDCNTNRVPDLCDLRFAAAVDCNTNGTPDICSIDLSADDCNTDRTPDHCQFAAGAVTDCDTNRTPDECDVSAGASDCNSNSAPDSCESNIDGDSSIDACDGCPLNEAKSDPGKCGCAALDIDLDRDGALDCVDECPDDPFKALSGTCGCGVRDLDSDQDGVFDCIDGCPNSPNLIEPTICGCQFSIEDCTAIIGCPADVVVFAEGPDGVRVSFSPIRPIADVPNVEVFSSHESGRMFPIGLTIVNMWITQPYSGQAVLCQFQIDVRLPPGGLQPGAAAPDELPATADNAPTTGNPIIDAFVRSGLCGAMGGGGAVVAAASLFGVASRPFRRKRRSASA